MLPEFDNMYLDMNGIIHACTHPNDDATSSTLSLREMMLAIFRYIDRMVSEIAKPKKILFMAIDGCAPRAKMNQQRSRRFRSAEDRMESIDKARQNGELIDESALFDSNCITPGTEFMEQVGKHLRWFIRKYFLLFLILILFEQLIFASYRPATSELATIIYNNLQPYRSCFCNS